MMRFTHVWIILWTILTIGIATAAEGHVVEDVIVQERMTSEAFAVGRLTETTPAIRLTVCGPVSVAMYGKLSVHPFDGNANIVYKCGEYWSGLKQRSVCLQTIIIYTDKKRCVLPREPKPKPTVSITETRIATLYFDRGITALSCRNKRNLDAVLPGIMAVPKATLRVIGHADATPVVSRSRYSGNRDISQQRADAVKEYLVANGIHVDRIESIGKGNADPVAPHTTEGRAENRRVEILLVEKIVKKPTRQCLTEPFQRDYSEF